MVSLPLVLVSSKCGSKEVSVGGWGTGRNPEALPPNNMSGGSRLQRAVKRQFVLGLLGGPQRAQYYSN